jgi:hypothetical protein
LNCDSKQEGIGQIAWRSDGRVYEIRHEKDMNVSEQKLREIKNLIELEELVRRNGEGNYRPLRGEKNLVQGWFYSAKSALELREVLEVIYPGAMGNWSAEQKGELRVLGWKEAAKKQTGRVQALIEGGEKVVEVAEKELCLTRCGKTPLWAGESFVVKVGPVPFLCIEPCPLFWENAKSLLNS